MEGLTRLVADSLARHGLDRPVDPRRLQWSRWSRCDSLHSLLVVPSKPGIFALAEEVAALGGASEPRSRNPEREGSPATSSTLASDAEAKPRRMLAVIQFCEDDDMAFTLDRMFTRINPIRERLASGRCFLRFVVIEDREQRRSICAALNQWMVNSAEKATGIGIDFQSSLQLTPARVGRTLLSDSVETVSRSVPVQPPGTTEIAAALNSGAARNLHCPHPLPSGF
jgi:hypothetical protein